MLFSKLAEYLEKLEKTASRNEMTALLAEALKAAGREEADKICYLLLGELLPAYQGVDFNIAEKMMIQVLAEAYHKEKAEVERLYKSKGDLGDVVQELNQKSKIPGLAPARPRAGKNQKLRLSVQAVYETMLDIAKETGDGSQERKIKKMAELISGLDSRSAKFAARIPVGKLRLGFSEATLLDAFSLMERGDKSARPLIERAYNITADIGAIAGRIKRAGLDGLKHIRPKPGIPIRSSLAERVSGPEEAVKKAGPVVGVEPKLDGFRTQIHIWSDTGKKQIALFSRNLENTTAMFPEIVAGAEKLGVKNAILDGETIGYNPRTGRFKSFQETAQRKRKYDIEEFAKKIPLSIFVFDVLYFNDKSLLNLSFRERRSHLEKIFSGVGAKGAIRLASHLETRDLNVIRQEFKKSINAGLEGLVIKNLVLPYEAGKRGFHWVKLKAATAGLEKLRAAPSGRASPSGAWRAGLGKTEARMLDTIDCVVMGAYKGRGKRTVFGVGGFLLGVRGTDDRYYTITRLGTGLSDEQFREAKKRIGELKAAEQPKDYVVDKDMAPDIWVKPSLVAEILADEITLSLRHTAGRPLDPARGKKGYSLRFPRLVRFRDDKNPEDATMIEEIKKMYRRQKLPQSSS